MIQAKVNVVSGWGARFAKIVNDETRDAVTDAVKIGADVASQRAQARRRTGKMAQMEVIPAQPTVNGWRGGFRSKAWYAGFQSRGTKAGINPLRFLEHGRTEARKALIQRLNRL